MYAAERVLKWVEDCGGVEAMERLNRQKSDRVYSYLEESTCFSPIVTGERRSLTNIPFTSGNQKLDQRFE